LPANATAATAGPFDEATYPTDSGELKRLSREQYERLPIRERVKLLLEGKLTFYKDGQEVPVGEALRG